MPLERRQILLGTAAVVVLGLTAWTFWPVTPPTPATGATAPAARARGGRPAAVTAGQEPVGPVKLQDLTVSRDGPGDASRNPFRFQPKAVAPPPLLPAPVTTETPGRQAPPVPTGPPPPAPIALKLIGVLERASGVKWAVLSDGKSAPMYGKDGDIIDGRYLIVKIGTESIEMTHSDGRGRQVIRLTGQ